ncbi:MAG: phosphoadenylyl-sulfate reductase, partial [Deltaproteobacteria bacterium HGW-Deltaproteobacteria-23]
CYRLKIDWYFPRHEAVEKMEQEKGLFSFRESVENRLECCSIRKVEPLSRALEGLSGWVTGIRREQSPTRSELLAIETDMTNGGIIKINPLIALSEKQLTEYATAHNLPINQLYNKGYRSIGCAPCTRAIGPCDQVREGRWWWENSEHKECGLHRR